jgi:cell division protein FtsA
MTVVPLHGRKPSNYGVKTGPGFIAALDIGSHKISCLIARIRPVRAHDFAGGRPQELEIIGLAQKEAMGIRKGAVVDMGQAERAIRSVVDEAERQAGLTIDTVFVNVSGGAPKSRRYCASLDIGGREVTAGDMHKALVKARLQVDVGRQAVLHAAPMGYALDGAAGMRNPEGMFGDRLSVDLSIVSVLPGPMRNLAQCINRCHLQVAGFVLAPFASGLATLVEDEMELGVALIEMGAGTTSIAVFTEGHLVYADIIGVGGGAVTNDIARGLSTPVAHAERIKTLHGSALASVADDRELITVPLVGEKGVDSHNKIPCSMLTGIIQPRLEETFEIIRDRLAASGFGDVAGRRVVLSGAASQMVGVRELAASILDRKVRLGEIKPLPGLPDFARHAGFATVTGLLIYGRNPTGYSAVRPDVSALPMEDPNYFTRVGQWLKQGF